MSNAEIEVYRGLTAKDIDDLVIAAVDDFDICGYYDEDNPELASHIDRVIAAREQIKLGE